MNTKRKTNRNYLVCMLILLVGAVPMGATDRIAMERTGEEPAVDRADPLQRSYVARGGIDLLLIPDSTADSVMAFDPVTGALVDAAFIPADPDNLSTPIQAILSASGDSILVSDQLEDVVQEYALDGTYMGIFAPAGGVDTSILDNVRGISLRDNGNLLVTVASGSNADAIAEFDPAGIYLGNFVANGDGGLDGPWAVHLDGALYSTGDGSDALQEFDLMTGAYVADLDAIDNFPEQAITGSNGNLFVANFLGADLDIVEVTPGGMRVGVYDIAEVAGARGVFPLDNGNYLVTNSAGVFEVALPGATLVETEQDGASARLISRVTTGAGGFTLAISGTCPGDIDISISGGTPSGVVAILRGSGPGSDVLAAGPCAGTTTDLANPQLLTTLMLDGSGSLALTRTVGAGGCGLNVQAVDPNGCATSNAVVVP